MMLEIQKYLISGKTIEDLELELGIKATYHPSLPIVILNYDQINSPKTNVLVREARALVLHTHDHSLIARSFFRFFNWGEVEEPIEFDFKNCSVMNKEDGSIVLLYHFDNQWRVNTRGSFALDLMQFQNFTWTEGICKALGVNQLSEIGDKLDKNLTYVCEFVSVWNKIVRTYNEPKMYLLTVFDKETELDHSVVDTLCSNFFIRPDKHEFKSIEEIQLFLDNQSKNDPTFEGVVICDGNGIRYKIKSSSYLGLHKLRGENDNLFNIKHLIPFILNGEDDELLTYYNEVRGFYFECKAKIYETYVQLIETWADSKHIVDQKEFALLIKDKPFASILFEVRKLFGVKQKAADLKAIWRKSERQILNFLKGKI